MNVLVSWIGRADLEASQGKTEQGPCCAVISSHEFSHIHLLSNYSDEKTEAYKTWLGKECGAPIHIHPFPELNPVDYDAVYQAMLGVVTSLPANTERTFNISSGTSAMAVVSILLSQTKFPATLLQSSRESKVKEVQIPFHLSMEYLCMPQVDDILQGKPKISSAFQDIQYQCEAMHHVVEKAQLLSSRRMIPVLIQGESGTGKELFARAIHFSHDENKPFKVLNCGAIPKDLIETELFGYEKGAFTGADKNGRAGIFESAHGGTIFLDEIGELPLSLQVRFLRVLQEKEVTRVGSSTPISIDVRIISATHRNLINEVSKGRFREDLFYRLAVGIIRIPPLREREGDMMPLIDALLARINNTLFAGDKEKKCSPKAINILIRHPWKGNVRELENTLMRACLWSKHDSILEDDIEDALLSVPTKDSQNLPELHAGKSIILKDILCSIEKKYTEEAWRITHHSAAAAARLLGFNHRKNITDRLKRFNIK